MVIKRQKNLFAFLALTIIVALLAGCSGSDTKAPGGDAEKAKEYKINIATATTGGVYYPMGNALAQIWAKNVPGVKAAAQATAGTPQNIELMENKEADIAFGQNGIAYYAYNGTGTYQGKPVKCIRGMLALYPNVMHMVVRKGSGIVSVADLRGKKLVPGQVASATEVNAREILSVYGLNYMKDKGETNVTADFVGYNEAVDLLRDGHTDAILIAGGLPTASVMDILASGQADLISLEDDKMKAISSQFPWYFEIPIPAGTYPNQDKEIQTLAVANMLIAHKDLPDDLIYELTKTVYDRHDDLVAGHQAAKDTTLETAVNGMIIPLHPGSIKYFKEQGINLDGVPTE